MPREIRNESASESSLVFARQHQNATHKSESENEITDNNNETVAEPGVLAGLESPSVPVK